MGASIHISGTGSSIVDTVFVCRKTGRTKAHLLVRNPEEIAALVKEDLEKLAAGGLKPSRGDARCVTFGQLMRLAVWNLRKGWNATLPTPAKLAEIARYISAVEALLTDLPPPAHVPNYTTAAL
jgi:hypothetical protein